MKIRFQPMRRLYPLSALVLILISAWELIIRMDAMYGPLKMFFDMAFGERIPLATAMSYFDFGILATPLYLTGCIALGMIALLFCRRTLSALFVMPASILLSLLGLNAASIPLLESWRMLRLIPLGGLALSGALKLMLHPRKKRLTETPPVRLTDAPRLRAAAQNHQDDRHSA